MNINHLVFTILLLNQIPVLGQSTVANDTLGQYYKDKISSFQRSNMDSAFFYAEKGIKWAKANDNPTHQINIIMLLSDVYYFNNQREKSFDYLTKALEICEENNLDFEKIDVLYTIGLHYSRSSRLRDQSFDTSSLQIAIAYHDKGIKLSEQFKNLTKASKGYNLSGVIFDRLGENEKAIRYYQISEDYSRQENDSIGLGYTLDYAGTLYAKLGRFKEAERMLLEALAIREKLNDIFAFAINLNNVGEFYLQQEDGKSATPFLEQSIKIANEHKFFDLARHTLSLLADIYLNERKFEKAYQLKLLEDQIKDELYSLERARFSEEMEAKFETKLKDREIAEKELEIALKNAEIYRNRWMLVGLLVTIILLITIGILIQNRLKHKQRTLLAEAHALAREAQIAAVIASQDRERNRFARDLHDTFGQLISVLNLNMDSLRESKPTPQQRDLVFQSSANVLKDMYSELKNVCFDLMPQSLIKGGIQPALEEFAQRINVSGKVYVETDFFGFSERLSELEEISLYRISQEWINNVLKYSDAAKIMLQLTRDEAEITLLIEDDGSGFDSTKLMQGKGNGWKNIQSRANLIKGSISLDTIENRRGNTLILNAPIPEKQEVKQKYPIDGILR